jgi:phosphonate transport system permease protein
MFAGRAGRPTGGFWAALGVAAALLITLPALRIDPSRWTLGGLAQVFALPSMEGMGAFGARFLETLEMAAAATAISFVISLPLSFAAAAGLSPGWLSAPTKLVLAALRSIPDLVWALILASAVGVGQLAGLAALIITTLAFLAKVFAESLETVPAGPIEALRAGGAGPTAVRRVAVLEQAKPDIAGLTLYHLDANIRAASILGLVGAGGIGFELKLAMDHLRYDRLGLMIAAIWLTVAALDQVSRFVRRRIGA